jgi:ABC-type transporter Mla maintaining outer membrane lipid asymmetry ATPase subunit MlaF
VKVQRDLPALIELSGISKDYRGLRPLRLDRLELFPGDRVGLIGFDRITAEVFVNLLTGASLPDAGRVSVFGRATADVSDAEEWLKVVDRFGIVSSRAALLDAMTPLQNLAMPFTLDVEPLSGETRAKAERLAAEAGLPSAMWDRPAATLDATAQMQVRFGRALALDPSLVLLEHASAGLDSDGASRLAESVRASVARRSTTMLSVGVDEAFVTAVGARVLRWEPATGKLKERRGWFSSRLG